MEKSWLTNPRGSKDIKRKDTIVRKFIAFVDKALPPNSVYVSEEQPPEGTKVFQTERGKGYWIRPEKPVSSDDQGKSQAEKAPSVEPKVHVTNEYSVSPANGRKITKAELPNVLYHVSPHHQKIQSSGTILALRDDEEQAHGGLGGPQTEELNNAAYFTTDPEHAKFMQKEMLRAGEIARLGVPIVQADYTDSDWVKIKELMNKYVDEDAQYIHSRLQAAIDAGLAETDGELDYDNIRTAVYEGALEPLVDFAGMRETRHFVSLYERNRADIAEEDFLDDMLGITVDMTTADMKQWFPLIQDPMFVGDPLVNFRDATPDTVGVSEVSKESVPDNALIRVDTAGDFLGTREVAIHADLPIKSEKSVSSDDISIDSSESKSGVTKLMKFIQKEGEGGGSFGEGGATVFTSTNAGIFTPTHSERGAVKHQKKKKKASGIERLGDYLTDNSPERKMVKDANFSIELIKWVTEELRKENKKHFRQQTSGETINEQPPRIDWKKGNKEMPREDGYSEYDAKPDKMAAIEQDNETRRIKRLDDGKNDNEAKDTDTIQLGWESGGVESDELYRGGDKDKTQGEVQDPEDEHEDEKFIRNIFKELDASEEIMSDLDIFLAKTSAE